MGLGPFIGREQEMALLEEEYRGGASLVLISGRKRVGKTRLLREFLKGRDALYFFANEECTTLLLESFSEAVSAYSGGPPAKYASWEDAFKAFAHCGRKRNVLAIDEFQNMMNSDRSMVARLRDIWDDILSENDVMLILCGSDMSAMESLNCHRNSSLSTAASPGT